VEGQIDGYIMEVLPNGDGVRPNYLYTYDGRFTIYWDTSIGCTFFDSDWGLVGLVLEAAPTRSGDKPVEVARKPLTVRGPMARFYRLPVGDYIPHLDRGTEKSN